MAEKKKNTDQKRYVQKPQNHNEPMNWKNANPEKAILDLEKENPGIIEIIRGPLPKSGN